MKDLIKPPEGSRKYYVVLIYLAVTIGLMFFKKITPDLWMEYSSYIVLAYMGGNVGEWIAKRGQGK